MLCACVHTDDQLSPVMRVDLPVVCEKILVPVPVPAVDEHTDARLADVKDVSALRLANSRIRAGHKCVVDQRIRYAGGISK